MTPSTIHQGGPVTWTSRTARTIRPATEPSGDRPGPRRSSPVDRVRAFPTQPRAFGSASTTLLRRPRDPPVPVPPTGRAGRQAEKCDPPPGSTERMARAPGPRSTNQRHRPAPPRAGRCASGRCSPGGRTTTDATRGGVAGGLPPGRAIPTRRDGPRTFEASPVGNRQAQPRKSAVPFRDRPFHRGAWWNGASDRRDAAGHPVSPAPYVPRSSAAPILSSRGWGPRGRGGARRRRSDGCSR